MLSVLAIYAKRDKQELESSDILLGFNINITEHQNKTESIAKPAHAYLMWLEVKISYHYRKV